VEAPLCRDDIGIAVMYDAMLKELCPKDREVLTFESLKFWRPHEASTIRVEHFLDATLMKSTFACTGSGNS
jgi:hypothetical protein